MPSPMIYQDLTTAALLGHAAQYHSETEIVSVSTGGEKERSCWGEVASRAQRLASALASLGLPPGARCATLAWNNRRHLEIYFAVASGGWVTHTVNPRLSVDHLRYILNDAADEVLFFDQTFLPLVAQLLPQLPTVKHVVLMESRSEAALSQLPSLLFYDDLLQQGMADYRWPQLNELTPASLCYTSGTTGRPKGVLNTHRSLVLHALSGNQPDAAGISAKDSLVAGGADVPCQRVGDAVYRRHGRRAAGAAGAAPRWRQPAAAAGRREGDGGVWRAGDLGRLAGGDAPDRGPAA